MDKSRVSVFKVISRWLTVALLFVGAHGTAVSQIVSGSCTPSFVDLGAFASSVNVRSSLACSPDRPLIYDLVTLIPTETVDSYTVSIEFELLAEGSFGGTLSFFGVTSQAIDPVTGQFTARVENRSQYSATIYYEDALVGPVLACGGCAGGRPLTFDSRSFAGSIPGRSPDAIFVPAGTYRIDTRTVFNAGPIGDRQFSVDLSFSPRSGAVTPVPEPEVIALQAVGLGVLAVALWRRRGRADSAPR